MAWINLAILLVFIAWRIYRAKVIKELEVSGLRIFACVVFTFIGVGFIEAINGVMGARWFFAPMAAVILGYILRGKKPAPKPLYIPPARTRTKKKKRSSEDLQEEMLQELRRFRRSVDDVGYWVMDDHD
ncbi:hypothetical protein [Shimazuella soli]|uniref:hypothetical protein n=1 Tax=Shimazuella soli TaxID=1892854 RepID=UPI001F100B49|nr:hypothetical protein [Shimazuella soli]